MVPWLPVWLSLASGLLVILDEAPSDLTSCTLEWELFCFTRKVEKVSILTAFWDMPKGTRQETEGKKKKEYDHSSILAWKIPWTEEPGGLDRKELDTTEQTHTHTHTFMNLEDQTWSCGNLIQHPYFHKSK